MAVKHIMTFKYIGSDVVSWATPEEGINYFVNAIQLNGTSDEYTEILRRGNETQFLNCTDELINDKSIKRVIEYEDEDARISAHASLATMPFLFSSLFKKCGIKFFESLIDTEAITIIEAEITCDGQADGRPDAKLPWETSEEAKDYIIDIINTYASDTDKTYFTDTVVPILNDSERTTVELLDVTEYKDSGPGPTSAPRPDGFSTDVWNYIYTGETPVFENNEDKTAFSLKVAEELTKFNIDDPNPIDSLGPNSTLIGSNKLKVSIKFSSQEEHDTYIQQYSWDAWGKIEIMLNDLGIEIRIL
jgi:hypothetical protein